MIDKVSSLIVSESARIFIERDNGCTVSWSMERPAYMPSPLAWENMVHEKVASICRTRTDIVNNDTVIFINYYNIAGEQVWDTRLSVEAVNGQMSLVVDW